MKKGIVFDCVPARAGLDRQLTPADRLRLAKDAGFDGVEFGTIDDPQECERLASAAREVGLEVPSIMASGHWKFPLSSPDEETRQKGLANIRLSVDNARVCGADTVLVVPAVVNENTPYELAWEIGLRSMRELAPYAEKHGVCLAVENVGNKFLLSPPEFVRFVDACDSPAVGAYFDVGNVMLWGFPDQWIRTIGPRLRKVHFKDYDLQLRRATYLLHGGVPWGRVRQALHDVGYHGYCTVEVSAYPAFPDQFVYDCARQLERILAGE
ncbi:MAG: sugar phosphate isomerase/epimerase family protein [Armatimonadota bacterium]|nr:sugar phosphate isomerase/epimerase family protein [Armatimonadota bacterium]